MVPFLRKSIELAKFGVRGGFTADLKPEASESKLACSFSLQIPIWLAINDGWAWCSVELYSDMIVVGHLTESRHGRGFSALKDLLPASLLM